MLPLGLLIPPLPSRTASPRAGDSSLSTTSHTSSSCLRTEATRLSRPGCRPGGLWSPHSQERPCSPASSIPPQPPEGQLPPSRGWGSGGTEPWTRTMLKGGLEYSLGQHCGASSKPRVLHRLGLCPLRAKGGSRPPSRSGPASPGWGPHTKLTRGDLPLGASERGGQP